ncbi:MAG: ankyrin repeat domain-containing protein [Polaribacter sp.]|uniref:ankyrin repeat domain-containing protein n=1 Tax=Polaribacter sp. TaxID=1920175 RepID=UPI002F35C4FD
MKNIFLFIILSTLSANVLSQDIFNYLETKNYNQLEVSLNEGKSTEIYNEKGLTPLWLSVFKNDTIALNLLLKYNVDINFTEKKGMHPIMIGCLANSYESVQILLKNGVDVNW